MPVERVHAERPGPSTGEGTGEGVGLWLEQEQERGQGLRSSSECAEGGLTRREGWRPFSVTVCGRH